MRTVPFSLVHKQIKNKSNNYEKFKKMFLSLDNKTIKLMQEKYLMYSFHLNSQRIPQYNSFLKRKGINPKDIKNIKDFLEKVPETNKKNYIYKSHKITNLCVNGNIHNISMIVKSSGHSGKQCYWVKSHSEDFFGKNAISIALDQNYNVNKEKTLIINGFILGSWVTGINFNEFASWHCPIINVGPDKHEIFQTIEDIGDQFNQILITGYPPFIKELVDFANSNKFNWKKHKINFIAGGEDFPESWRDYISKNSNNAKTVSGFGASDIGILGGIENNDTIFIRKLADKNHQLKKDLFGKVNETPMLFQYPTNLYVYANKKQELIFTSILPETAQPVIKYNLQDIGGTLTHEQINKTLKKHGIIHKIHSPLPFMYVMGRKDGPVNYNAFLIYPENIEECIYRNKQIAKTSTSAFKFRTVFDNKHNKKLLIEFELKPKVKKTKQLENLYLKLVTNTLTQVNEGYRATRKKLGPISLPKVILYENKDYPYKSKIKNNYN